MVPPRGQRGAPVEVERKVPPHEASSARHHSHTTSVCSHLLGSTKLSCRTLTSSSRTHLHLHIRHAGRRSTATHAPSKCLP